MSQNSQDLVKQLQQKVVEAEQAETRLQIAQSELAVVNQERNKLQSDIASETDRLLKQQRSEIKQALSYLKSEKSALVDEVAVLNDERLRLTNGITLLSSSRVSLTTEVEQLTREKGVVSTDIETLAKLLAATKDEHVKTAQLIDDANSHLASLEEDRHNLINEVEDLHIQHEEIVSAIKAAQDDLTNVSAEKERLFSAAEVKLANIHEEIKVEVAQIEAQRNDLAIRKVALDDRDKNLRIREQKAASRETAIKQNAALLEL